MADSSGGASKLQVPQVAITNGLKVISYKRPSGCMSARRTGMGDQLVVDYTGWLCNGPSCAKGKQFDSSIGRRPFKFVLGSTPVILGW